MKNTKKTTSKKVAREKKTAKKAPKKAIIKAAKKVAKKAPPRKVKKAIALPNMAPITKQPETKLSENAELMTLNFLEKSWPHEPSPEVEDAFMKLKAALTGKKLDIKHSGKTIVPVKSDTGWPFTRPNTTKFDCLDLIRRILMAHDMLFLSRQITYHISASADLPAIWGDRDRISQSFSRLIEHQVKRADRGSRIDITITPFALRGSPGAKISFESNDHHGESFIDQKYLDSLLEGKTDEMSGISIYDCRQAIVAQKGQMWVDMPKPHRPLYNVVLPASEEAAQRPSVEQQTFKYDISIINYSNVRKRFGIKKSASLVSQIEHYIKSLVRYPIDMVMSVSDKGVITTIYETQKGAAESVASRISQRLGKEDFRIGKRPVELAFKYELSKLTPEKINR